VIPWNIGAIASIYLLGVWLVSRRRSTRTRALTKTGSDDSYGVYLAQLVFITALGWAGWRHLDSYVPWPIVCLFTVLIVFTACVLLTEGLARTPLSKALTGRSRLPRPEKSAHPPHPETRDAEPAREHAAAAPDLVGSSRATQVSPSGV
jgi:hypothetical protein